MNKPHKHAELIKAWADGAEIEYRHEICHAWNTTLNPTWKEYTQYRIKPQPVITKAYMHYDGIEDLIKEGDFNNKDIPNVLWCNNNNMHEHLEFTFIDNKLTKVEIKKCS